MRTRLGRLFVGGEILVLCLLVHVGCALIAEAQNSISGFHGELLREHSGGPASGLNSAGWNTGYSVITTTRERVNPLGSFGGGPDRYLESTSRLAPNDPLGQPVRGTISNHQNSHGWFTGYSAVTSTYTRPSTIFDPIGSGDTVTESVTQVVPNDPLGQPMLPFGWP